MKQDLSIKSTRLANYRSGQAVRLKRSRTSRGIALLELAIVMPFFLLVMIGTFEIGRAFNQYLILTQIAYEGVRAGSQLAEVSPACFGKYAYGDPPPETEQTDQGVLAHAAILSRVGYLIALQQAGSAIDMKCDQTLNPGCQVTDVKYLPTATTEYIGADISCASGSDFKNSFGVSLSGMYQPLLLPEIFAVPMNVRARSVLLIENEGLTATGGSGILAPTILAPTITFEPE